MYGPDLSSSDDEYFADDPEYEIYKEKERKNRLLNTLNVPISTDSHLKEISYNILNGKSDEALKLLEKFSENKIDIELQNGWTPFLLACSTGKKELVIELLNRGADLNQTKDGLNALMLTCDGSKETSDFIKSSEVIQILIDKGINVNALDRKRRTALMIAAYSGNLEAVKLLLPLTDREAEDNQRWTALFWAVYGDNAEVVKYLLDEGFSIDIHDVREFTPAQLAKEFHLDEVLKLFPNEEIDSYLPVFNSAGIDLCSMSDTLKSDKTSMFFQDICSILHGVKNQNLIKLFSENNTTLKDFLSLTDSELIDLDIQLPFQRNRIITGLYKFHKHSFDPKSLPIVGRTETYSNIDVGKAIISAIKQLIAMESSLMFILKNENNILVESEKEHVEETMKQIRKKIRKLKRVTLRLSVKAKMWDEQNRPADLISSKSGRRKFPWRKLIFTVCFVSLAILWKVK